jgi:polyketide cyclase/dehydrase/lipid transport protein
MVKVTDDGLFPASREKVWRLIQAHNTDISNIHPSVKSVKLLRKEGNSDVVEQERDMNGQRVKIAIKFTANPPNTLTLDFLEGPMTGKMVNTYTEFSGGTKVVAECDMKSKFMDEKQLEGAVKQFLNDGFNDDVRYLSKMK